MYGKLFLHRLTYSDRVNHPGFPGECFVCELRLPDHLLQWKRNMPVLLLPAGYDLVVPATVDCCTRPPVTSAALSNAQITGSGDDAIYVAGDGAEHD